MTPEAFWATPLGDVDFPTAFIEAAAPTFFEPWASVGVYMRITCRPRTAALID